MLQLFNHDVWYRLRLKPIKKVSLIVTKSVQNFTNKKTEKRFDTIKEEAKIESNEPPDRTLFKPKLSNKEGKPTTNEEGEDHIAEVVDSKPTIMEHEAEPINVKEKFEVEVQKSEAKTAN